MVHHYWRSGVRAELHNLARTLRADGRPWPLVADTIRRKYRINALTALRLAHGYTQSEVADQWCQRWPDDPKTFKNISYWENWPGKCSREPSLIVLSRLAEIYQCAVADLVAGLGDHSYADEIAAVPPLWHNCPHGCGWRIPA